MRIIIATALASTLLAGCNASYSNSYGAGQALRASIISASIPVNHNAPSAGPSYRAKAAAVIRSTIRDPASIRDAYISALLPAGSGRPDIEMACVRLNARNGFGGMTGPTNLFVNFHEGQAVGAAEDDGGACDKFAVNQPFNEVMGR